MSANTIADALRRPAVQIAFGIHALAALILSFVPLFDVVGFERAFVTGLVSTLTSPIVTITLIRRAREHGSGSGHPVLPPHSPHPGDRSDLARVAAHALLVNLGMLLPSLLAGVLVEAVNTPCDPEEGLLFMFLCAGGNAFFGTALGLLAGTIAHRRGLPGIIVAATLIGFFGIALGRLYAEPQIFVYSVPFGFWPGSIYDEQLAVSSTLIAFRAYTFFYGLTIAALVRAFLDREQMILTLARPRLTAAAGVAILAAITLSLHQSGEELGFDLTRETIERELARRVVTEEFEIFIDPSVTPEQVEEIVLDHRFRFDQLARFFDFRPGRKIKSFVYRDAGQKQRLMGAGQTQISRPWASEIHIDGFTHPHPVLKHELAHAFSAEIASGLFKVPATGGIFVNIGVVEGLAVAADWRSSELTVHGWTRAMRALDLAPDLRNILDVAGFWAISSARAYTVAGSFVRHLIDEHGMEKFAVLYSTNDFTLAYGRSLDALVTEWEQYVDSLPLPEGDLLIAEHRFKRPGIFQKVCAHKAANLSSRGYGRLGSGDVDGGIEDLLQLLEYTPNDPTPLISISSALARQQRLDEAKSYAERALGVESSTQKASATARESLANIEWQMGLLDRARAGYEQVLTLHLSTPSDRLQIARLGALERPRELQDILRDYLIGELQPPLSLVRLGGAARVYPQDALLRYLYAKSLESVGAVPEAITEYEAALSGELPGEPLALEAKLALGRLFLAADQPTKAEAAFRALAREEHSPAVRLEAGDWADRAAFVQTLTSTTPE
jgi:tetratricopeptide (TPR) repeat protein